MITYSVKIWQMKHFEKSNLSYSTQFLIATCQDYWWAIRPFINEYIVITLTVSSIKLFFID